MRRSCSWRLAVVGVGLLVDAALTAVDAAGPGAVTIGLVPIVPLFLAAFAGPWQTGFVAVVGLVLVAVSGAWDHDLGSVAYDRRVVVGVIVGALAVVLAASRERIARDRERFRLLADLAEVADGRRSLADTAGQVCALLVPTFADLCMMDVLQRGCDARSHADERIRR